MDNTTHSQMLSKPVTRRDGGCYMTRTISRNLTLRRREFRRVLPIYECQ